MYGIGRKIKSVLGREKRVHEEPLAAKVMELCNYRHGYYIELGANDGLAQSNTLRLEKELEWHGLLIEAIPHKYFECRRNRSDRNRFCHAGVVGADYTEKFVELQYSNLMTVAETSHFYETGHARSGSRWLSPGEDVIAFGAPARTLDSILAEVEAPNEIDLLSLDVEGGELAVLQGIDFGKYCFKYMVIESREVENVDRYLADKGYVNAETLSHRDYLYIPRTG